VSGEIDKVRRQYETYPYPERDPADEAKRMIVGSPSDLLEIDHFLFQGRRDWSKPFRALVAGGGTGDGLVQLAQGLADAGCPAEVVYLDMSEASRAVAEARIAARGLTNVVFRTGDLLTAPKLGLFDYIDCCGVLHHLPEPQAGFDALVAALGPEGGMGLMVYAPYGRTGVYPLQEAFGALLGGDEPAEQMKLAKAALKALPPTNWFRKNDLLVDHKQSDAGLYDLLLHSRDRPFGAEELLATLERAGLGHAAFLEASRYDPMRYLPDDARFRDRVAALSPAARAGLAERLAGNMRLHIVYAAKEAGRMATAGSPEAVPHLKGVAPRALAEQAARKESVRIEFSGLKFEVRLAKQAARLIALMDGRPLGDIAKQARLDWLAFSQAWGPVHRELTGVNLLRYSRELT
jgi:SAM-dependent methyltransferase